MRARLGAYGLWQLRDFVFERAAAILIVALMLVFGTYEAIGPAAKTYIAGGGRNAQLFGARGVAEHLGFMWFIAALIAVHGISSNDRTTGRFRLMFAKPVRVLPYYGQAFALHGIAFMVCSFVWLGALSRVLPVGEQTATGAIVILACSYLLVGGVCFLMSAITRFDWVATGALFGAVLYLASKFRGAWWLDPLPPFWRITEQLELLKKLDLLEARPLLWAAAYGVACFLLGLIVLKRRPLAT